MYNVNKMSKKFTDKLIFSSGKAYYYTVFLKDPNVLIISCCWRAGPWDGDRDFYFLFTFMFVLLVLLLFATYKNLLLQIKKEKLFSISKLPNTTVKGGKKKT